MTGNGGPTDGPGGPNQQTKPTTGDQTMFITIANIFVLTIFFGGVAFLTLCCLEG